MKIFIEFLAGFFIICATVSMAKGGDDPADLWDQFATDPLNGTYMKTSLEIALHTDVSAQPIRKTSEGFCKDWQSFHTCNASLKAFLNRLVINGDK